MIDLGGTVTTGGTAQNISTRSVRLGFFLQNLSSGDLWVRVGGTAAATQPSLRIPTNAYYESPAGSKPYGAISVFGATTSQAFAAGEWV